MRESPSGSSGSSEVAVKCLPRSPDGRSSSLDSHRVRVERGESPQENQKVIVRGRENTYQENKTMDDLCGQRVKERIIHQLEVF